MIIYIYREREREKKIIFPPIFFFKMNPTVSYTKWVRAHPELARQIERTVTGIRFLTSGSAPFQLHNFVETLGELLPLIHDRVLVSNKHEDQYEESQLVLYYQVLSRSQVFIELFLRLILKHTLSKTMQWNNSPISSIMGGSNGDGGSHLETSVKLINEVVSDILPNQLKELADPSISQANNMANKCLLLYELIKVLLLMFIRRRHVTWAFKQLVAPQYKQSDNTSSHDTNNVIVPRLIESEEDLAIDGVTHDERLAALLELLDYGHAFIPALLLLPTFGRPRSTSWDRWIIWFLILIIANIISTILAYRVSNRNNRPSLMLGKQKSLFVRESSTNEFDDANITRRFLLVEHLLRDPAFRYFIKPIVIHKIRQGWFVRRIPLFGSMLGRWIDYHLSLQRQAFSHAQIDTRQIKP